MRKIKEVIKRNVTFKEWKMVLDVIFCSHIGLLSDDVKDYNWWNEYESNLNPMESFEEWKLLSKYTDFG